MLLNIRRTRSVSCDVINCQQLAPTVGGAQRPSRAVRTVFEQHERAHLVRQLEGEPRACGRVLLGEPAQRPDNGEGLGHDELREQRAADARRGGRAERRLLDAMRALDLVLVGRGARGGGRERAAAVARGRVAPARLRPTVTRLSGGTACAAARRRATRLARARAARRGRSPWPDRAAAARARGSRGAPCRRAITRASARSPSRARPRAPRLRVAPVLARAVRACGLGRRGVNVRGGRRARSPRHACCTTDGRRGSIWWCLIAICERPEAARDGSRLGISIPRLGAKGAGA